jgi:hypothetical protein
MNRQEKLLNDFKTQPITHLYCPLILFALTIFLAVLMFSTHAVSADITLVWGTKAHSNLAGYHVYYGTCSGVYTSRVDVGKVNSITISNLDEDQVYYFSVTAYDYHGVDGRFSEEVVYDPTLIEPADSSYRMKIGKIDNHQILTF